ncbi:MAG: hypothetical protein ACTSPN_12375 [Promethearchaeota archaeon]
MMLISISLSNQRIRIDPYLVISGGIIDLLAVPPEVIANFKKNKI